MNKDFEPPTEKQLDFIEAIEARLSTPTFPCKFEGTTKQEASEWISEHEDDFYWAEPSKKDYYGRY